MNRFSVWIRPLDSVCRVRVEGTQNARWLLQRLGQSFVFKSSRPINDDEGPSRSTFQVPYSSQMSRAAFENLLVAIPEVSLMFDPA